MLLHDRGGDFTAAAAGTLLRLDQFRETKIENLRMAIARDHDVVGFQIPMNDASGVSFGQAFGYVL